MLPLLAVSSTAMAMASKVCVIVGLGNKGIGDACAMKWAKEGFKVAMLARRQETLDELEKSIPGSKAYRCDATQPTEVESTLQAITSDLGPIDVCIYNAGLGVFKRFEDTTFEEFETSVRRPAGSTPGLADERPPFCSHSLGHTASGQWRCGPAGLFCVAKAVVPEMAARGGGVFGITGATASWRGVPMTPAFAAAKMGVRGLAQARLQPSLTSA